MTSYLALLPAAGRRFILIVLAGLLTGGWSIFQEKAPPDPDQAAYEALKPGTDTYQECVELATEADTSASSAASERWPQLMGGSAPERRNFLAITETPSAYESECARPLLRGCLLPEKEGSTLEEFIVRVRQCPLPPNPQKEDCVGRRQRIAELNTMRPPLVQAKNEACSPATFFPERCRYLFRRLQAVIEAVALNEVAYERGCF
jgi:hypothetical protein